MKFSLVDFVTVLILDILCVIIMFPMGMAWYVLLHNYYCAVYMMLFSACRVYISLDMDTLPAFDGRCGFCDPPPIEEQIIFSMNFCKALFILIPILCVMHKYIFFTKENQNIIHK